ncbi:MAG: phenol hydroxylase subunit P4 [Sedimenticola sp.]
MPATETYLKSIGEYPPIIKDKVENFHGNQLVFVGWDHHLFFDSPRAFPLPPEMPFGALVSEVMPVAYTAHPEWEQVKWDEVQWMLDGEAFTPNMEASLEDNGVGHKSLIRFKTPGLNGIEGSGS